MSTTPGYTPLRVRVVDRERVVNVHKAKVPAATEVDIISREFFSPRENYSDEFTTSPHPVLLVEADKTWCGGVNRMIPAHFYLWKCRGVGMGN